jgi:hypothetical protein
MTPRNPRSASTAAPELQRRVNERFGVLPNFFRLSPETPEITEKLWGFAQAAYLDNPLPSVFKERLFVHLSRFCAVRYCIARHTGFLVGLGRPAGDKDARAESVEDVVKLLRRPVPRGPELDSCLSFCSKCSAPLVEMPTSDTPMEDGLFSLASHVFLQTADAPKCLDKGMSQERLAEVESQGVGLGIRGMRERVRQSHGELTVDSNALGTKITAISPAKTPAGKEQSMIARHGVE